MSKKALTPVIAVTLLLVVVVITIVLVNIWFDNYRTQFLSDVEIESKGEAIDNSLFIEGIYDNKLYVRNTLEDNLSISKIKIGEEDCGISQNLTLGINYIDISLCIITSNSDIQEVSIISNDKIITKTVYLYKKDLDPPTLSFSSNATYINYNSDVNLTWNSLLADSCFASGDWSGSKALNGSQIISNITTDSTFTLECTNSQGTASKTVYVYILNGNDAYTVLMLHGDGDSSSSQNSMNFNGNGLFTSIGKFNQSFHFDGIGDYLSIPDSDDWALGTGDFTIDFWINLDSLGSPEAPPILNQYADNDNRNLLYINNLNELIFNVISGGESTIAIRASLGSIIGSYHHLAVVRNGTTFYIFKDGILLHSETNTSTVPNLSAPLLVGRLIYNSVAYSQLNGSIDELRISKGIARWTSNFTLPTFPYTTDSYTKLLLHLDGDVSQSEHNLTFNDNIITSSTGEFNGSLYFDGTDDYISTPDSNDWDFGTGDFTIDFWMNSNGVPSNSYIVSRLTSSRSYVDIAVKLQTTGVIQVLGSDSSDTQYNIRIDGTIPVDDGNWHHIAFVRSGTTSYLFIDGQSDGNDLSSSCDFSYSAGALDIGRVETYMGYYTGYIDELRISKGIARWTSDFTPPSKPYD